MIGNDLTGLFERPPAAEPWQQGTITAFDASDGSNTVSVAGASLSDLPLLNIGDTVNLAVGDVVVLARFGGSWCILGRVVVPGGDVLSSSAVGFDTGFDFASNFAVTTSFTDKASFSLDVPAWANRALVVATAYGNCTGGPVTFQMRTTIGGTASAALNAFVVTSEIGFGSIGQSRSLTVTPGGTVTVTGQMQAASSVAQNAFNAIQVVGYATFTKA